MQKDKSGWIRRREVELGGTGMMVGEDITGSAARIQRQGPGQSKTASQAPPPHYRKRIVRCVKSQGKGDRNSSNLFF